MTVREVRIVSRVVTVATLALALALTGCGAGTRTGTASRSPADPDGPTRSPSASATADRWLAVIATGALADDLDEEAESVKEALGPAMVVSPVDCFEGLPPEAGSGYVLGAMGSSERSATETVEGSGRSPLFVVPVTVVCSD